MDRSKDPYAWERVVAPKPERHQCLNVRAFAEMIAIISGEIMYVDTGRDLDLECHTGSGLIEITLQLFPYLDKRRKIEFETLVKSFSRRISLYHAGEISKLKKEQIHSKKLAKNYTKNENKNKN